MAGTKEPEARRVRRVSPARIVLRGLALLAVSLPLTAQNKPNLSVVKHDDTPNTVEVEEQVIFTLEVWNKGTGAGRDVVVRDWINPDWFRDIVLEDCGLIFGDTIVWDGNGAVPPCAVLQTLEENAFLPAALFSFRVTLSVTVPEGTLVCNQATVEARNFNQGEPVRSDDPEEGGAFDPTCFWIVVPADRDRDGDGIADEGEIELGTDPDDADSEDDGVSDGEEVRDGLDPLVCDTDGDGLPDGQELGYVDAPPGTDPAAGCFRPDADPDTVTDPLDPDTDDDGLADGCEDADLDGAVGTGETDPNVADSDGDGLADGCEDRNGDCELQPGGADGDPSTCGDNETDPTKADTDGDGTSDSDELGGDCDCDAGDSNPVINGDAELRVLLVTDATSDVLVSIYPVRLAAGGSPVIVDPDRVERPLLLPHPVPGAVGDGWRLELFETHGVDQTLRVERDGANLLIVW